MRNIFVLNRYYPPNPAVTGESASNLVDHLVKELPDARITVIHVEAPYSGGGEGKQPDVTLKSIKSFYHGKNKLLRFLANAIEGRRLLGIALEHADLVISLTDPPLLNYWAGKLCNKKNIPWIYWSLDLYPYAFISSSIVSEENIFYKHMDRIFRSKVPSMLVALGELQADYIQRKWTDKVPHIILPCGIQNVDQKQQLPSWRKMDGKIYFAYIGNMGEAHDPDFVIDFIDCLDESKHRFVLSGYGSKIGKVIEYAKNNRAVELVKSVNRNELHYIDVHLVSLLPKWTHVCVPSKAVSAVCAGQTVLFNGVDTSDTWQMFHPAGWLVSANTDRKKRRELIRGILTQKMLDADLARKKSNAANIRANLLTVEKDAYRNITDWIQHTLSSKGGND